MTPFLMVVAALLGANLALGKSTKGPGVACEGGSPSDLRPTRAASGKTPLPAGADKMSRRRCEANLLAPIPARLLGGMFVLKGDFYQEQRQFFHDADAQRTMTADAPDDSITHPDVAGVGAVYLKHASEGAPPFLLVASRYGSMSLADDSEPMIEAIIGTDIADDDLPMALKFSATDQSELRLLVRYRQFPGFHRWLVLIGNKIDTGLGWTIDVTIPSHIIVGWKTPTNDWRVYGGVRWKSIEYPFASGETKGWQEGFTTTYLLGVRRAISAPFFVALEAGMSKERIAYIDTKGETLAEHETKLAPWARLALETWIETL